MADAVAELLARHLRPGTTVALADGAGAPRTLAAALPEAARLAGGGIRVFTGWWLERPFEPTDAIEDTATYLAASGLRRAVAAGNVRYVPTRLSRVPKLVRTMVRPELALLSARPVGAGLSFCSEVGWLPAALDTGAVVVAELNDALPLASRDEAIPLDRVAATIDVSRPPIVVPDAEPSDTLAAIGERVAALVPEGASIQFGPGGVGQATVRALSHRVSIDSGLLTDPVVELDRRGLLDRVVASTYAVGTEELYDWLSDRRVLVRVEESHDIGRLLRQPLVAVNTALELDLAGSVNVESAGGRPIAGVGGHPDYAVAASLSPEGISVVALSTVRGGRPTLVRRLDGPASTARCDVDVVVTETGVADLRGRDDRERERLLRGLWGDAFVEDAP